jgi:hypothetical protein
MDPAGGLMWMLDGCHLLAFLPVPLQGRLTAHKVVVDRLGFLFPRLIAEVYVLASATFSRGV